MTFTRGGSSKDSSAFYMSNDSQESSKDCQAQFCQLMASREGLHSSGLAFGCSMNGFWLDISGPSSSAQSSSPVASAVAWPCKARKSTKIIVNLFMTKLCMPEWVSSKRHSTDRENVPKIGVTVSSRLSRTSPHLGLLHSSMVISGTFVYRL